MYGVSHTNRLSRIDLISREDALTFLEVGCYGLLWAACWACSGRWQMREQRAGSAWLCRQLPRPFAAPAPRSQAEERRARKAQAAAQHEHATAAAARKGKARLAAPPESEQALEEEEAMDTE